METYQTWEMAKEIVMRRYEAVSGSSSSPTQTAEDLAKDVVAVRSALFGG